MIGVNDEPKAMSSSGSEEIPVEQVTQEIREQQIVRRFDFSNLQNGPQRGSVILRFLGFGVVRLVGIEPNRARVGDIAVEVTHRGYYTSTRVWLKVVDGAKGWTCTSELQTEFHFTTYLA
jgi:hypothetical protein